MSEESQVILALGSNKDQEENMRDAIERCRRLFGKRIRFTRSIWTEPVNVSSDRYLNCLAVTTTRHGYPQVYRAIKQIERSLGAGKAERTKGVVRIDIDILQFGNKAYHENDWERDYIQFLMKEL